MFDAWFLETADCSVVELLATRPHDVHMAARRHAVLTFECSSACSPHTLSLSMSGASFPSLLPVAVIVLCLSVLLYRFHSTHTRSKSNPSLAILPASFFCAAFTVFDPISTSQFRRDEHGRISNDIFFQYVLRKVTLAQTRIQLSLYDTVGDGFLREMDLERYMYDLIPQLPALRDLLENLENFMPFYVFTAVRKFFFFLDPKRRGKIAIKDMLSTGLSILDELHVRQHGTRNTARTRSTTVAMGTH